VDICAVFLDKTLEDNGGEKLAQCRQMTRCGNLAPLSFGNTPQLKKFTATRAVEWGDSETIDESRLPGETDAEYEQRMQVLVNTALADLQASRYEASIMSDALFVSARGGETP